MASTTIGNVLINEYLPPDVRNYSQTMGKKEMVNALTEVANKHPQHYATVTKALKDLGDTHSYLEGSSFLWEEAKPVNVDHIFKKYEPELNKARKIEDRKTREKAFQETNLKIEHEVNNLVDEHLTKHPDNNIFKWSTVGGKGNRNNLRQMFYASGNQMDVANKMVPFMARSSFAKGLSPSDALISATGARKGIVESFISVRDPGALAKEFFMLTNSMVTSEIDCGSKDGLTFSIDSEEIIDRHLAKDAGNYKRNDVITKLVQNSLKKAGVKAVLVRSPNTCLSKEGVCQMCVGILENGKLSPVGDTVGLRSSQALTEKLTQMALSSKHTGGVVGKKSAFDTVKQLLHVPENFPGGAILSQVSGNVHKIETLPDGGKKVWVNDTYHYVDPKQKLLISKGQELVKGDPISDGLINPAEIVRLKGMQEGRNHLARALQSTYKEMGGIAGKAKVFETVSRAILNLGEVEDAGDHEEFEVGDKVKWNQNQDKTKVTHYVLPVAETVGWRSSKAYPAFGVHSGELLAPHHIEALSQSLKEIPVYKNPMKIKPVMFGTERAAIYGGDWISNLGFRFVKDQLKENVAKGAKVNIHSYAPLPAYVYGAEFGQGVNGRF